MGNAVFKNDRHPAPTIGLLAKSDLEDSQMDDVGVEYSQPTAPMMDAEGWTFMAPPEPGEHSAEHANCENGSGGRSESHLPHSVQTGFGDKDPKSKHGAKTTFGDESAESVSKGSKKKRQAG